MNNKPDLSIIMPGIRPQNWVEVYTSILNSTKRTFELVIISPFPLPKDLVALSNVKYVKDFGSPVRASNIGCSLAELLDVNSNYKHIIVCKYSESKNRSEPDRYQDDSYYKIVNAYPANKSIVPSEWWIFNTAFWHRTYFDELGWFDTEFEVCPMAHCDLAIRAQKDMAEVKLSEFPIIRCDWGQDDHKPIEIGQIQFDTPRFIAKYNQPLETFPSQINKENWKFSPSVWNKRFKINE